DCVKKILKFVFCLLPAHKILSPVYGQKGASVHLTVEGLQRLQIIRITWKYNNTDIVEHTLDSSPSYYNKNYTEKIQFDSSDFSLLIKKLDETNRGIYTATIKDKNRMDFVKNFRMLICVSAALSAEGFCTVSVNCSVRDSWVYYTCNQTQCSQTEPQSWPDVNITVTVYNGNITCTGSNRVSKETQSEPLGHACEGMMVNLIITYIRTLNTTCYLHFKLSGGAMGPDGANTMYVVPPTANRASSPNTPQDNTVYCTVGHPKDLPPRTPRPAHCDDMSIYSQVKK
uniref:Immunoglobulin subtype domain-containing protein n=1 Tax=Paramormyrops kingsleyae TaxID=1676925 RepID=A0A3B3QPB1_9TELE